MQLTITGVGAISSKIGAHPIRDGPGILLCDADPAHVGAINRPGGGSSEPPGPRSGWPAG